MPNFELNTPPFEGLSFVNGNSTVPITIEFIGLPGSGKTTLAAGLLQILKKHGIKALSQKENELLSIRRRNDGVIINLLKYFPRLVWWPCAGTHRALPEVHRFGSSHVAMWEVVTSTLRNFNPPSSWVESILYSFLQLSAEYQLAKEHLYPDEIRIVEEGFVHRGYTLFGYLNNEEVVSEFDLIKYLQSVPLPSLVIFVDVEPEECWERIAQRAKPPIPLQALEPRQAVDRMVIADRCVRKLVGLCGKQNIPTFCIDNNQDKRESALEYMATTIPYYLRRILEFPS